MAYTLPEHFGIKTKIKENVEKIQWKPGAHEYDDNADEKVKRFPTPSLSFLIFIVCAPRGLLPPMSLP